MSRPRHRFGQQPGRIPATMLRALSAELSEPGRYSRGKRYAADGAVTDIEIRAGEVTGEVLGSRREPYRVSLCADPDRVTISGDLTTAGSAVAFIPDRTEMSVECTCPDGAGGAMCKHAIAVLLVFADEVSIEPELLARWRGATVDAPDDDGGGDRRDPARSRAAREAAPRVDVLASMLASPVPVPPMPNLRSLAPQPVTTPRSTRTAQTDILDAVLTDAIAEITRGRPTRRP